MVDRSYLRIILYISYFASFSNRFSHERSRLSGVPDRPTLLTVSGLKKATNDGRTVKVCNADHLGTFESQRRDALERKVERIKISTVMITFLFRPPCVLLACNVSKNPFSL